MKTALSNADGKLSKTKLGALLFGLGALVYSIANLVVGNITLMPFITQVIEEVAVVLVAFGVRDLPILNSQKA